MNDYRSFLEAKFKFSQDRGFDFAADEMNPICKPHQVDMIRWAVKKGRAAIFARFGLGKTVVQLEILRLIGEREGGRYLIVAPLGVRQEFRRDAAMLGLDLTFVRRSEEVADPGIYITNYESVRDGKLDVNLFAGVSLDEASVLRSYGSKTYQTFLALFDQLPYRFVATATPSPNRYKELIHYAGFLGVMDTGQALTRFFQRDSTQANNLTLYPHMEAEFFLWLHSWALFVQRPSDLGHSDDGYDLPPLNVIYHELSTPAPVGKFDRDGQGKLVNDAAISLKDAAEEKRDSIAQRVARMMEIVLYGERGAGGVPEGVLREEQSDPARETARARQEELPRESGKISRSFDALEDREPGALSRTSESERAEKPREASGEATGVVSEEQRPSVEAVAEAAAGDVRPDSASVRADALRPERPLCDLRINESVQLSEGSEPARGSLSRHGHGSRPAVSPLQLGARPLSGQPGTTDARDRLSEQIILWCDLNDEQRAIEDALDEAGVSYSSIFGSLDVDEQERRLQDWRDRKTVALIGKPVMLGSGVNLQQCNRAVFVGITYKFNDLLQAIHRIHRYLQSRTVHIHILYTNTEQQILKALQAKWKEDDELRDRMSEIIRKHGLSTTGFEKELARTIGCKRRVAKEDLFELVNNDSVEEYRSIDSNRFDLIATSIPFGNHYEYSPSYNDFGHNQDNEAFFRQMDFLTPELLRTLKPGRVAAIHVKDRIRFGNVTGYGMPSVDPFHADCIAHYRRHGFIYFGMITVVTDVVRENNQTYRLGWTEQCKDGTKMGVGSPEYVLLFRKLPTDTSKGYADERVVKSKEEYTRARWQLDAHAFWRSSGNRLLTPDELSQLGPDAIGKLYEQHSLANVYDYEEHVRIGETLEARAALPATFMCLAPASHHDDVWHDVTRMQTLNGEQSQRGLSQHICPLQFDVVDRLITRYTNPGEEVSDPFGGLFTVPYRAIKLGRRGHAVELNPAYFVDGVVYVRGAAQEASMPSLFDYVAQEASA